ncbi:hypothetical protein CLU79DRAFT_706153 [Phycomyces nitens]|nr:hypothetical protein CLU79DRAFT_706153 [Phycomyces nitens]
MSPKSRRTHKKSAAEEARPRPRLHAHHRIRSDPVQVEPPLTIDQHLSNYHRSLRTPAPAERFSPHIIDTPSPPAHPAPSPVFPTPSAGLFYQHRPLTFPHLKDATPATFSLLHPTLSQSTAMKKAEKANKTNPQNSPKDHASDTEDTDTAGSSSGSLLQLAHIVSTFG